jgi:aspartate carbamoyltransferase catalytic subunit
MKHLLGIEQLSVDDIEAIFDYAHFYKKKLQESTLRDDVLYNKVVVLFFCEPSTRTRVSFEIAAKKLEADVVNVATSVSSLQKGETLLDTLQNLQALQADFIVMRHSSSGAHHQLAPLLNISLINAGDGSHEHPSQALLDGFTLLEKFKTLKGKNISIIGDILHSRVARSNLLLLKKLGANVTFCGPPTLLPVEFEKMGAKVTYDIKEAIAGADALNVLRIQKERQEEKLIRIDEYVRDYRVDENRLQACAKDDIWICHPGPVNREIELTSTLIDDKYSLILQQVTNGLLIRMAIFRWLSEKQK